MSALTLSQVGTLLCIVAIFIVVMTYSMTTLSTTSIWNNRHTTRYLRSVLSISTKTSFYNASHTLIDERLDRRYERAPVEKRRLKCPFPIVYNKPGKTGSTFIQRAIMQWAVREQRPLYKCGGVGLETALRLSECLPYGHVRTRECAVLTNHIDIDQPIDNILKERMPNYRLITSTRYPPHRVVSSYLQEKRIRSIDASNRDISDGLRQWLKNEFQPEYLVPQHFGTPFAIQFGLNMAGEIRKCPVSLNMKRLIYNVIAKYFIVIDANLVDESNAILKHFNLFQLPVNESSSMGVSEESDDDNVKETIRTTRVNKRGTEDCVLDDDVKELLWNLTCFDRQVHLALQMRMASLYEVATGEECFRRTRMTMRSCLHDREEQWLNATWKLQNPFPDQDDEEEEPAYKVKRRNRRIAEAAEEKQLVAHDTE